jgi:RsbT co-antagonist protein rsbRD N-terminal domain
MAAPLTVPIAQTVLRSHEKSQPTSKESVAAILKRCKTSLIADWLTRTKSTPQLNHLHLSDEQRTGHLPKLVDDLVARLGKAKVPNKDSDATSSPAAVEHGKLRRTQGYSSAMLIHESRILQVTIFGTLHKHLTALDFSMLLPDVMIIADEVDAQLTQTMESFTNGAPKSAKAHLVIPKG